MEKHKHVWEPHPVNPNKVICECGTEQYRSKLSEAQLRELMKLERPVLATHPVDLIMHVGRGFYTPEGFIEEARRMGACKRVPMVPRGVIKDVTRVFLAHENAIHGQNPDGDVWSQTGIFAWFTVRGISYVVDAGVDIKEALKERGVTEWQLYEDDFGSANERGCGNLEVGGTYLLSEEDIEKCRDLAHSSKLEGRIEVIEPPIPTGLKRFRGFRAVSGDFILAGEPEESWYATAYEANQLNKVAIAKYKRKLEKWEKETKEAEG